MLSRIFDSAQHRGAREPEGREDAAEQQRAAADLQAALRLDDPADVGDVALAEVGDHALLERVEFAAEGLGLLGVMVTVLPPTTGLLSDGRFWRFVDGVRAGSHDCPFSVRV